MLGGRDAGQKQGTLPTAPSHILKTGAPDLSPDQLHALRCACHAPKSC